MAAQSSAPSKANGLVEHAIASLFPPMSPEEYEALKADIQANGLREPIWLYEGRIIDGRHRYRACKELGIAPATREWDGAGSLTTFVVSLNLHRRSLTSSQRGAIALEAEEFFAAEIKRKEQTRKTKDPPTTKQIVAESNTQARDKAAVALNTNRQYVSDAKTLKAKEPDLFHAVRDGKKTIPQAKNELRKREKAKQLEAKAAEFRDEQPVWTLIHQDVMDGLQSVLDHHSKPRLIFADPPYNIGIDYGTGVKADKRPYGDYLQWFGDWIAYCHELLADDGSLWVMIGDEYAAEYNLAIKRCGFTIRSWIIWYETFGANCSQNFNRTHRHIFYAVKNAKRFVFNESEVSRPSDRQTKYGDKRAAEGGKLIDDVWIDIPRLTGTCEERIPQFPTQLPVKLVRRIVECASDPGDLVVDPFSGSGTTGVACIQSGRKYVGIDSSEKFIDLSTKRLKATTRDV